MDNIAQALDQIHHGHYDSASALLREEMSGIEWGEEEQANPTMERDCDILHAINAIQAARVFGRYDAALHRQAVANVEALLSGDRSALEAMEARDATVAAIELGEDPA